MRDLNEAREIQKDIAVKLKPVSLGGDPEVIKRVRASRDKICAEYVDAEKSTELSKEFEHGSSFTGLVARFFINSRLKYIARHEFNKTFQSETGVDIAQALDDETERKRQKNAEWQIVTYSAAVYAVVGAVIGGLIGALFIGALFGSGAGYLMLGVAAGAAVGGGVMAIAGAIDGYIGEKMATRDMKADVRVSAKQRAVNLTTERATERNRERISDLDERVSGLEKENKDMSNTIKSFVEVENKRRIAREEVTERSAA